MNFKEFYIREKFYDAGIINGRDVEVFVNPSRKELEEVKKADTWSDFAMGTIKNDVYVWPGSFFLHGEIEKKFKLKFDIKLRYLFSYPSNVFLSEDEKNRAATKKVLNLVKRYFPKVKQIVDSANKVLVK